MSRIRILPEAVANRIAAGEVVERPASVVKELLENALDAGATAIRVEVESGGRRMIRVIDDGHGMTHDDALLAFERHATSKLKSADDLMSIATLGFRGEAMPTIAAVSQLLLETRDAAEPEGVRVQFAAGKLVSVKSAGLPPGTTVSVADLFYSVPARRKFLKSETTELGHIASLVTHYALANPGKQFVLTTPTQQIIDCPPVERLADRIYQLFGKQSLDELVEIPTASAAFRAAITEPELEPNEESARISVYGFTSRPEVQRPNRNGIYVFVNRRLVRDRLILHAIHEAYRNILPGTLLFLEMPYDEVDVNVHPAKIEVRFRRSQFVHDFTRDSIRQVLMNARAVPSFAAAAGAGTGANAAGNSPNGGFGMNPVTSATQVSPYPNSNGDASQSLDGTAQNSAAVPAVSIPHANIPPLEDVGIGSGIGSDGGFELTGAPLRPVAQRFSFESASTFGAALDSGAPAPLPASLPSTAAATNWAANFSSATDAPGRLPHPDEISDLKPLGQVSASFIIAVN